MRSRGAAALLVAVGLAVIAAGCGDSSKAARAASPSPTRPATTRTSVVTTTTTTLSPAPTTTAGTTPPPTAPPTPPRTTTRTEASPTTVAAPSPLLVTRVAGIGSAAQVITVAASGYGANTATLTAYERGANGWKQVFGPWFAYVGRNGVAPAGAKREGDGRTPSGVYGFDFMFGINPDPGVHYPYRRVTGSNIVWDDDANSANYNEWIDKNTASAGVGPEPMYNAPSYYYGAVIAYNDARTPGLGSAIFLHVSHGSATAGCVALPADELLSLLRWLDPARTPRIAIGTLAALTS